MNIEQALQQRSSVRAFTNQTISGEIVRGLLKKASQAPSGGNMQPWRVTAVGGQALKDLSAKAKVTEPVQRPGLSYPAGLWEPYRSRRFENGEDLYRALNIGREDKAARLEQLAKNSQMFGAPVGIFIAVEERMGYAQWIDLGIYLQSFMLLAAEQGLATCAQGFWRMYSDMLIEQLALPAGYQIAFGVALGYEDTSAPINQWQSSRADSEEWLSLKGLD
ncbi:nitroreductase [Comamonas sp. Y33R10-2]|uniref:nitroreductase n=1 Tax=Comamonas sp. Y33R10-2 TaxID=2853257 RepID=UPI001C5C94FD|nr:nitroreductase [Comamonas sp. Y33R10-2]QXZ10330.1 nitroreductase [Comamonas sp. Y33R10-2]